MKRTIAALLLVGILAGCGGATVTAAPTPAAPSATPRPSETPAVTPMISAAPSIPVDSALYPPSVDITDAVGGWLLGLDVSASIHRWKWSARDLSGSGCAWSVQLNPAKGSPIRLVNRSVGTGGRADGTGSGPLPVGQYFLDIEGTGCRWSLNIE